MENSPHPARPRAPARPPRRALSLLAAVLTGALLGSACIPFFSLDPKAGVIVQVSLLASEEALESQASVRGGNASAVVTGQIAGKLPCDLVSGDVKERGRRVTLIMLVQADINQCRGTPPTTFRYLANIVSLDPGEVTIRVEHRYSGLDTPNEVVLEELVEVN